MGRKMRVPSSVDIYHIGTRGVGQQNIYNDDADRNMMLHIVSKALNANDGTLYAWTLMSNHYHFLLMMDFAQVPVFMQTVNSRYARYFNRKYDRVGHLFQQRYWQDPIESEERLLACVRYIHLNPLKAGLSNPDDYPWSSYQDYIHHWDAATCSDLAGAQTIKELFGSKDSFVEFHKQEELETFSEGGFVRMFMNDEDAAKMARALVGDDAFKHVSRMSPYERDRTLKELKEAGISIRQLQRLTGLGRYIISKA